MKNKTMVLCTCKLCKKEMLFYKDDYDYMGEAELYSHLKNEHSIENTNDFLNNYYIVEKSNDDV